MTTWFQKPIKGKRLFYLITLVVILSMAWVAATEFVLDAGAGIIFPTETFENHSNNVQQNENRTIIDWEKEFGQGLEINASFLITNQLSVGFGAGFYQINEEYGPTNIANGITNYTNYVISYFPFWVHGEYYFKPKSSRLNITFSLKLGLILWRGEFFAYENNNVSPTDRLVIDGLLITPSIKFLYGIRPYSHIYLEFQYILIANSYFRHHPYLGVGLKYRFRPHEPLKKIINNDSNVQFPTIPNNQVPIPKLDFLIPP